MLKCHRGRIPCVLSARPLAEGGGYAQGVALSFRAGPMVGLCKTQPRHRRSQSFIGAGQP